MKCAAPTLHFKQDPDNVKEIVQPQLRVCCSCLQPGIFKELADDGDLKCGVRLNIMHIVTMLMTG